MVGETSGSVPPRAGRKPGPHDITTKAPPGARSQAGQKADPPAAKFRPGDRVRVRLAIPAGHCRTPAYVRGKTGVVERVQGAFRNPESLAYGLDGLPKQSLYLVRFDHTQLWGAYRGAPHDTLLLDIFEHWLEPA